MLRACESYAYQRVLVNVTHTNWKIQNVIMKYQLYQR